MVKFWTVIEEQRTEEGQVSVIATPKDNFNEAESTYYSILSAAAISSLPYHAASILESNRGVVASKYYDRSDGKWLS